MGNSNFFNFLSMDDKYSQIRKWGFFGGVLMMAAGLMGEVSFFSSLLVLGYFSCFIVTFSKINKLSFSKVNEKLLIASLLVYMISSFFLNLAFAFLGELGFLVPLAIVANGGSELGSFAQGLGFLTIFSILWSILFGIAFLGFKKISNQAILPYVGLIYVGLTILMGEMIANILAGALFIYCFGLMDFKIQITQENKEIQNG